VQEGWAFCRHCNAPQIRVAMTEAAPSSPSRDQAAAPPVTYPHFVSASGIEWRHALAATAIAGLVGAILMLTPLQAFGLGMVIPGALSVVLYRRRKLMADITPGMGARLGIVTGMVGFGVLAVPLALGAAILHLGDQMRALIILGVEQAAARSSDPQAQQAVELVKTPQGSALFLSLALILTFLAFVIFSALGGALGAALLRRRPRL
jgi:hypothetical protein